MTSILLTRSLGSLRPVDEAGEELIAGMGRGEIVRAVIKRPRNVGHHRRFFALVGIVAQNSEQWKTTEEVLTALKVATGHVKRVIIPGFGEVLIPQSISFAAMDQTAFEIFYDRCVHVIVTKFIPGLDEEVLREEVLELIGGTY